METKINRRIDVPTGSILIVQGERGQLECLSIGDYGKEANVKCRAIGLNADLGKVEHRDMLPLEEKWVVTISTQYGCAMNCSFCDVPRVGPGRNASYADMLKQVVAALSIYPEVISTKRLNIHFARMGEPTFNSNVLLLARDIRLLYPEHTIHPVVSTMLPRRNSRLREFISDWMSVKNEAYDGDAGLQLSINSTNDVERGAMFAGNSCTIPEISQITGGARPPRGRKITLNFAVADYEIDPDVLLRYFSPERYIVKLTPMHKTTKALANGIETEGEYDTIAPYQEHEERLVAAGYDVIVFVASKEEDLGRITCGNAILSGLMPGVPYTDSMEAAQ